MPTEQGPQKYMRAVKMAGEQSSRRYRGEEAREHLQHTGEAAGEGFMRRGGRDQKGSIEVGGKRDMSWCGLFEGSGGRTREVVGWHGGACRSVRRVYG
jgi:hypothetical protein